MNERELREGVEAVRAGRMARRCFVRRLAALGVSGPAACLMLAHAGIAPAQTSQGYKPARRGGGGTLRLLFWQGPTLLNPHFATGTKDQEGSRPFCEPLARWDAEGQLVEVLAAGIPGRGSGGIAADGKSTTWRLRKGVTWHDGAPFTADDVVFNWQFATDPAAAAVTAGDYLGVRSLDKLDDHTVRVVFDRPTPLWHRTATVQLIPRHLFDTYRGARAREAPNNLRPVGTGPYRFVDFKPGDLVRGVLHPAYYLPNRPHFDAIEIKGGGDATSAGRTVLQTGEYDYAWNLLVEEEVLRRLESGGKGRVVVSPSGSTEMIFLNMADPSVETQGERAHPRSRHPVLGEPAVRQALLLLADRPAIKDVVFGRTGIATPNVLNQPAMFNSTTLKLESSVEKANALLDAAGWKRGNGGVREKDGRKLRFVFATSINSVRQKVQAIYKQSCAKAGIELELKAVAASVFFSSDQGNPDTSGKFWADLQMYARSRTPDPDRYMQQFVSWEASSKANKWLGLNIGRWASDEYDRLYRASESELDPVRRAALFIRMNDLVCGDAHVIPLATRPSVAAVAHKLVAPLTGWDSALSALHDWYREA